MTTPNYNLKKTELTNTFTQLISNEKDNCDIIDTALKNHDDAIEAVEDKADDNTGAIAEANASVSAHLASPMPHKMLVDGVAYNYGLSQTDGFVKFIYEEEVE